MSGIGNATVLLVLVLSTLAMGLATVGGIRGSIKMVRSSEYLAHALAAITSFAMLVLIYGLVVSDFTMAYVHDHSDRGMPLFYRITAVWAGMEGSMLTWVWALALVSSLAIRHNRQRLHAMLPQIIAMLMSVVVFFGVLMAVHSNPFDAILGGIPLTGKGLNPLLQNPYMVTHPPALYLGFVGLTVPFAFGMAALWSGQKDDRWIQAVRPWAVWAWYFLSLGLVLGMLWAYEELGWGGYWGWDPVENAALMPWLVATGFLHSIIIQERRQMFRAWSQILGLVAFVMTIFGTFMTRSGFIDSVHAFARSNIGYVFIVYMVIVLIFGFGLIIIRLDMLKGDNEIDGLFSREAAVLLLNWLLVAASLLVMGLTIFPNVSELFGEKINIAIPVFKTWMTPVGVLLLVLTALCPALSYRQTKGRSFLRLIKIPAILGFVVSVAVVIWGVLSHQGKESFFSTIKLTDVFALIVFFFSVVLVSAVFSELVRGGILRRRANSQVSIFGGMLDQIAENRRRYGGYIVHIGVALMCAGFAGDAFKVKKDVLLKQGERATIGAYTLRYDGLKVEADNKKTAVNANLTVFKHDKAISVMQPARWFYFSRPKEPTTEVSIYRTLKEDLFVGLGRYTESGDHAGFMLVINPLVNLIWFGFIVMTLGAFIAGFPRLRWRRS